MARRRSSWAYLNMLHRARRNAAASPAAPAGDPNWANVVLLIQGATLTDASSSAHTIVNPLSVTAGETGTKKFTSSMDFDANDELEISLSGTSDFDFATGEFTIEMWYNLDAAGSNDTYFTIGDDAADNCLTWHFQAAANTRVRYSNDGSTLTSWNIGNFGPNANAGSWIHMALVRDGDTLRMYVDGVQVGSHAMTAGFDLFTSTGKVSIGDGIAWNSISSKFIEDIRVTKGVCRYPDGTTFTVPTENFPTS